MEFSGERYVPEVHGNIELEHLHRYIVASELVVGKNVLDIASGEGYGSDILARKANKVTGVDISKEAIQFARNRYQLENLDFKVGNCTDIPLADACVDVVVSFETIEHLEDHEKMLREVKRVLHPEGLLIISSPDKYFYSVEPGYHNPFHKKELFEHEFKKLLNKYFKKCAYYQQRITFGSTMSAEIQKAQTTSYFYENNIIKEGKGLLKPMYWIGLASDLQLPDLPSSILEQSIDESETVKSWRGTAVDRDHQIQSLEVQLSEKDHTLQNLEVQLSEKDHTLRTLEAQLSDQISASETLRTQLTEKGMIISELSRQLDEYIRNVKLLQTQLTEKEQLIADLGKQKKNYVQKLSDLQSHIDQREKILQNLNSTLLEIYSSTAWKIIQQMWKVRLWLAPTGSWREQFGRRVINFFQKANSVSKRKDDSLIRLDSKSSAFNPKISIIVPNYNHATYLNSRLDSIYNQTYHNFEVIILDDCSTDSSQSIIRRYQNKFPEITQVNFNEVNSGNIFSQWRKGITLANGELIWIAESDDFCNKNFLEKMIPCFLDESVLLSYSHSIFVGENNEKIDFTFESYLSEISTEKWKNSYVETAHNEVATALAIKNTIPNVSSVVFRRPHAKFPLFEDEKWLSMKICGDWYFYLNIIQGGKISYCHETNNYYRIHADSSSKKTHEKEVYYREHEYVACCIAGMYDVSVDVLKQNYEIIREFYFNNMKMGTEEKLNELFNFNKVLSKMKKRSPNILMAIYSFTTGGGEILPIRLANALKDKGVAVTILNGGFERPNLGVRQMLYPEIPVINYNQKMNLLSVVKDFGIECVHTHHACMEYLIASSGINHKIGVHHVCTMHGMYEMMQDEIFDDSIKIILDNVDHWFYIADKNLTPFIARGFYHKEVFTKINNGMNCPQIKQINRNTLGINKNAFMICLASRALPDKGWKEAMEAVKESREITKKDIHLVLIGDGIVYDDLLSQNLPSYIHLLGFEPNVIDYFSSSDLVILPSYYRGESVPLTIIEGLFADKPIIASNIGEISNMLSVNGELAGIVINIIDGIVSTEELISAIIRMVTDNDFYVHCTLIAKKAKEKFRLSNIADEYLLRYAKLSRSRDF